MLCPLCPPPPQKGLKINNQIRGSTILKITMIISILKGGYAFTYIILKPLDNKQHSQSVCVCVRDILASQK